MGERFRNSLGVGRCRRTPMEEVASRRPPRAVFFVALLAVLTSTMGAGVAGAASSVTEGLLLTGTDAAHARFIAPVDSCHTLELAVGYVQADRLQSPLGSGQPNYHSDVGADVSVYTDSGNPECGDETLRLSGVAGIDDPSKVNIESLQSASIEDFTFTLTDGDPDFPVAVTLTFDLYWAAQGRAGTEIGRDPANPGSHSAHRRVDATVTGTVVVESIEGPGGIASALDAAFEEPELISGLVQTEGFLTRYQEIQVNLPHPEPASPPSSHPDMEGVWLAVDCAQWWEHGGPLDCSVWGDGSAITLTIGPGDTPFVTLEDDYSAECNDVGSTVFTASGYGEYSEDGISLHLDQRSCGAYPAGDIGVQFNSAIAYVEGSPSAWQDPDGDGWGYTWYRQP